MSVYVFLCGVEFAIVVNRDDAHRNKKDTPKSGTDYYKPAYVRSREVVSESDYIKAYMMISLT